MLHRNVLLLAFVGMAVQSDAASLRVIKSKGSSAAVTLPSASPAGADEEPTNMMAAPAAAPPETEAEEAANRALEAVIDGLPDELMRNETQQQLQQVKQQEHQQLVASRRQEQASEPIAIEEQKNLPQQQLVKGAIEKLKGAQPKPQSQANTQKQQSKKQLPATASSTHPKNPPAQPASASISAHDTAVMASSGGALADSSLTDSSLSSDQDPSTTPAPSYGTPAPVYETPAPAYGYQAQVATPATTAPPPYAAPAQPTAPPAQPDTTFWQWKLQMEQKLHNGLNAEINFLSTLMHQQKQTHSQLIKFKVVLTKLSQKYAASQQVAVAQQQKIQQLEAKLGTLTSQVHSLTTSFAAYKQEYAQKWQGSQAAIDKLYSKTAEAMTAMETVHVDAQRQLQGMGVNFQAQQAAPQAASLPTPPTAAPTPPEVSTGLPYANVLGAPPAPPASFNSSALKV